MTDSETPPSLTAQMRELETKMRPWEHGWADTLAALTVQVEQALIDQRVLGHGEGQEHAIADVNAGLVDDLIQPRLSKLTVQVERLEKENDE